MKRLERLEDSCDLIVVDGSGHYCRALNLPDVPGGDSYPHEYCRVMCYGQRGGLNCRVMFDRYGVRSEVE